MLLNNALSCTHALEPVFRIGDQTTRQATRGHGAYVWSVLKPKPSRRELSNGVRDDGSDLQHCTFNEQVWQSDNASAYIVIAYVVIAYVVMAYIVISL